MAEKLWTADPETMAGSQMSKFMAFVNKNEGTEFKTYRELYNWSVNEPVRFWTAVWDFFDIIGTRPADMADGKVPPFMSEDWFPGAKCNYAENMHGPVRDGASVKSVKGTRSPVRSYGV